MTKKGPRAALIPGEKIPALNCSKHRGAPYAFLKTKSIQGRLTEKILYRIEDCICPGVSSDPGK